MSLQGGADVNFKDKTGVSYTPLHLACIRSMFRAAEALLELGLVFFFLNKNLAVSYTHLTLPTRRTV